MRAIGEWLQHTPPSEAIQSALWFIRLLQATHLITAGIVSVSGIMIALRVLGYLRTDESFTSTWSRFSPWLLWGAVVMLATGLLQVLGDPVREFTSTSFWLKVAFVLCALIGTLLLARGIRRSAQQAPSMTARWAAAGLIFLWLAIPLLGRMIGYDLAIWGRLSLRS